MSLLYLKIVSLYTIHLSLSQVDSQTSIIAMDSFGEVLQKLKEVYEQDVEGEMIYALYNIHSM